MLLVYNFKTSYVIFTQLFPCNLVTSSAEDAIPVRQLVPRLGLHNSIHLQDVAGILRDKSRLQQVMRGPARSGELAVVPVTVAASRSHRTVTDTRRVNERNIRTSGGKIQTEKVQTERHEVYESNESETSDAESDFEKIEYEELVQEEPLEYKTKTEESFIEYFQKGQNKDKWVIILINLI